MIIWSGLGFLVAIIVFACALLTELVAERITGNDQFYQDSAWGLPLALVIAAAITFVCDRIVRAKSPGQHSLFFIPMKWWAPLLVGIAALMLAYNMTN